MSIVKKTLTISFRIDSIAIIYAVFALDELALFFT
jgi:hypothetical protein